MVQLAKRDAIYRIILARPGSAQLIRNFKPTPSDAHAFCTKKVRPPDVTCSLLCTHSIHLIYVKQVLVERYGFAQNLGSPSGTSVISYGLSVSSVQPLSGSMWGGNTITITGNITNDVEICLHRAQMRTSVLYVFLQPL